MSEDSSNDSSDSIPLFCINCANIGTNASGDTSKYKCFAAQNCIGYNLVTGVKEYYYNCESARAAGCGLEANWFILAPPKPAYTPPAFDLPAKVGNGGMDLSIDQTQLAASQDAAKERMRLLLASRKSPAKAATNLLESL